MLRTDVAIVLIILLSMSAEVRSQQRIAASPANLMVTGETRDNVEVSSSSRNLVILYEGGMGKGELDLGSLSSPHEELNEILTGLNGTTLYLEFPIPEGKFAFGDSMNERFSTQGTLMIGDMRSEFTLNLDVSNIKDSKKNNFKVLGTGRLSLLENFGVAEHHLVMDGFGFVFNQNLKVFQP